MQYRLKHVDGHAIYVKVRGVFVKELYEEKYPVVYFIYTDITSLIMAQKRFKEEQEYQNEVADADLLVKARVNLTHDIIESYHAKEGVGIGNQGFSYIQCVRNIANAALTMEQRERFLQLHDRGRMMKAIADGDTGFSIEYQRKMDDGIIWVESTAKVFEKTMLKIMMDRVVSLDYDYFCYIDMVRGTYRMSSQSKEAKLLMEVESGAYEQEFTHFTHQYVLEEDIVQHLREISLEEVCRQLEKEKSYTSYVRMQDTDGSTAYKKLQFSYLDREQQMVMLTRCDVTEIYNKEQRHNEKLKNALAAAQQANHAKTEFLSRIESGKMLVRQEVIPFESVIQCHQVHSAGRESTVYRFSGESGWR